MVHRFFWLKIARCVGILKVQTSSSTRARTGVLPYLPDLQEEPVKTVLAQAVLLYADWV
ncbi:MAG: hypothetical protein RL693_1514 [Verrucomicrobiota bacterium]|jgi:hypothetical protein